MKKTQVIASCDPLRDFKERAQMKYPNCAFFESDFHQSFDIGAGYSKGSTILEGVITDGNISLQKKNPYSPVVIFQNNLLTLENGTSISITIEGGSFMVNVIRCDDETQYDIHVEKEEPVLLQRILDIIYSRQIHPSSTSSIAFTSPSILTLESLIRKKPIKETFDFKKGIQKRYK